LHLISDGTLLMDGGAVFGPVPRVQWERFLKPDRRNRVRLSLNCLLIRTGDRNILVDTGAGSKRLDILKEAFGLNGNKLVRGLKAHNLTARDIDTVVLTNLRFDRAGGCTKVDRSGKVLPTFPKAKYVVQKAALDDSRDPGERSAPLYQADDLLPLVDMDMVEVVDGDKELAPGVSVRATNGPSPGHQVVTIESGSERVVFAGDLIPTSFHLPPAYIGAFDDSPNDTLAGKHQLLSMATDKGWMVVFGQAQEQYAGYVELRAGRYGLTPVLL
jgi:glyoxylase-like metal-dependent hydrolase (beta-lactamase superfamily II)